MTDDDSKPRKLELPARPSGSPPSELELGRMVQKNFAELERLGLIRRTGEIRSGKPVFELTELGRSHLDQPPPDAKPQ
jgi:hypothetical protein